MKILVYDVAAEYGGALTILKMVYEYAANDSKNEWIFVLSNSKLVDGKFNNITVLEYSKPKKSWLHRLYFDKFDTKKILTQYNPDLILNLQNVMINTKIRQILYMHQAIPFCEKKFSILDLKLWIYQNIIGKMIFKSIEKCDKTIVQTNWLKNDIVNRRLNKPENIIVKPVEFKIENIIVFNNVDCFFYPAGSSKFKNHKVLIEAWLLLKEKYNINPKLILTLNGDENKNIIKLKEICTKNDLNVHWDGMIPHEEVLKIYSSSILIFPSYLESFGLPLLEAKLSNTPIITANTLFAHDILDCYDKKVYFDYNDSSDLLEKILYMLNKYKLL